MSLQLQTPQLKLLVPVGEGLRDGTLDINVDPHDGLLLAVETEEAGGAFLDGDDGADGSRGGLLVVESVGGAEETLGSMRAPAAAWANSQFSESPACFAAQRCAARCADCLVTPSRSPISIQVIPATCISSAPRPSRLNLGFSTSSATTASSLTSSPHGPNPPAPPEQPPPRSGDAQPPQRQRQRAAGARRRDRMG